MLILAIELKENPFFCQKRGVAYHNKYFTIFKFRTIRRQHEDNLRHQSSHDIFDVTYSSCRLTPFANWMRRTGLDELPQIYNIISGKMSFIGPRPFMIQDLKNLNDEHPVQSKLREKIKSKPGIAGLWQIFGERKLGVDNLIRLDLLYEENKSFILDVQILYFSILIMLFAKNSDALLHQITSAEKLFSISNFEFVTNHGKYLNDRNVKTKSTLNDAAKSN